MVLFINHANRGSGVHTGPALGASLSAIGLQWKIHENIFFSEITIAKTSIFGMQHCYVELYINPAKHPPGVGPFLTPGVCSIAPLDLQLEKYKKNLLRNHMAQSFHMLCGLMYNTLLYKCCHRCRRGPCSPRPRHVIIYHRLIMEIHEKIFSATA